MDSRLRGNDTSASKPQDVFCIKNLYNLLYGFYKPSRLDLIMAHYSSYSRKHAQVLAAVQWGKLHPKRE